MRRSGKFIIFGLFLAATALSQATGPVITSLNPTSIVAGSATFTLNITGGNFVTATQIRVNNSNRPTQFVDSQHVRVTILSTDISTPRALSIIAVNPGTPASAAVTFQVVSNVPSITSVNPSIVPVGSGNITITVTGTGFASTAVVRLDNTAVTTTFVSQTQVTAVIPASETAVAGTNDISVRNPSPFNQTSNTVTFTVSNSVAPAITLLDPSSVPAGSPGFTLTIVGTNFVPTSFVRINSSPVATTFIDSSHLTVPISSSQVDRATTLTITVTNPPNLTSPAVSLAVTQGNPPAISSITPSSVPAGSGTITLAVTGTGFTSSSIVRLNGFDRTTTFIDVRHLNASIPSADLAVEGSKAISVFNPPPNGGTSGTLPLTVFSPLAPVITSLSPPNFSTGSQSLKLTVTGSRFSATDPDVVLVDGSPRATEFVNGTTLVATLLDSDVAVPGTHTVTVENEAGLTSAPLTFSVSEQSGPVISTIDPFATVVGAQPFTLTLNGTNFVEQSIVTIDGAPRQTTFVSPTQLTVQITASDLSSPRVMAIAVLNPNGVTSASVDLTVALVAPSITGLSPSQAIAADSGFTLIITGTGLGNNSVVRVNGEVRTATFDASTGGLAVTITSADLAAPGTLAVTVTGPGGTSAPANLAVLRPHITSVTPSSIAAGSDSVIINVTGTSFLSTSKIVYLGTPRETTFDPATGTLSTVLSAADLGITGQIGVRVQNSADVLSAPFLITVSSPGDPRIDSIDPSTLTAGGASAQLTVRGANFLSGAAVRINGVVKPTQFVSGTELVATLSSSDLSTPGTFAVTVINPDSTASGAVQLTIAAPQPPGGRRRAVNH